MYTSELPEIRAFHPTKSSMLAVFPIANRLHFTIGHIRGRCIRELPIRARHSPQSHYHVQLDGSVPSPLVLKHLQELHLETALGWILRLLKRILFAP